MANYFSNVIALWKSKTFWLSIAITVATALSSDVQAYVSSHPGTAASIISLVFGILMRSLTTQATSAKGTTTTGS